MYWAAACSLGPSRSGGAAYGSAGASSSLAGGCGLLRGTLDSHCYSQFNG